MKLPPGYELTEEKNGVRKLIQHATVYKPVSNPKGQSGRAPNTKDYPDYRPVAHCRTTARAKDIEALAMKDSIVQNKGIPETVRNSARFEMADIFERCLREAA